MDGIYINGRRPKSKKEIKDLLAAEGFDPHAVEIENTSIFGGFGGSLAEAERQGLKGPFTFVGPDPYTSRRFYGTLKYNDQKGRWVAA